MYMEMYVCICTYIPCVIILSAYLVDFCLRNKVCKNGGTCVAEYKLITCKCVIGFTGIKCEFKGKI